jgi:hypothetical protein
LLPVENTNLVNAVTVSLQSMMRSAQAGAGEGGLGAGAYIEWKIEHTQQ